MKSLFSLSIAFVCLIPLGFVYAVPAMPIPDCKLDLKIEKVELIKKHSRSCPGGSSRTGQVEIPDQYLLHAIIQKISIIQAPTCVINNKIGTRGIYKLSPDRVKEMSDLDKFNGGLLRAVVRSRGDECESGAYINSYDILKDGSVGKEPKASAFSKIMNWFTGLIKHKN